MNIFKYFLLSCLFITSCSQQLYQQSTSQAISSYYQELKNSAEPFKQYLYIYPHSLLELDRICLNNYAMLNDKDKKRLQLFLIQEYNKLPRVTTYPEHLDFSNEEFHHNVVRKRFKERGFDRLVMPSNEKDYGNKDINKAKDFLFSFILTPTLVVDILKRIPDLKGQEKKIWQRGICSIMIYANWGESCPYRFVHDHYLPDDLYRDAGINAYTKRHYKPDE